MIIIEPIIECRNKGHMGTSYELRATREVTGTIFCAKIRMGATDFSRRAS